MQQVFQALKEYIKKKRLTIPLIVVTVYLLLVHVVWGKSLSRRFMYLNLVFYLFIANYYFGCFRERHFLDGVKTLKRFLAGGFLALCCLHVAAVGRNFLIRFCLDQWHEHGMIDQYVTESYLTFTLYSFIVLILIPIGEELFFRYAMISFASKKETALTVIFSILLYVAMNANYWTGLMTLTLPVLVYTICYLLTKNIYLTILIHIINSIVLNGEFIGYAFARMIYR